MTIKTENIRFIFHCYGFGRIFSKNFFFLILGNVSAQDILCDSNDIFCVSVVIDIIPSKCISIKSLDFIFIVTIFVIDRLCFWTCDTFYLSYFKRKSIKIGTTLNISSQCWSNQLNGSVCAQFKCKSFNDETSIDFWYENPSWIISFFLSLVTFIVFL